MWITLIATLMTASTGCGLASGPELYVCPDGRVSHNGRTEPALQSLAQAQKAARKSPGGTVWLAEGVYRPGRTLRFTSRDSGTAYRALPGHKVVISGGVVLRPEWTPFRDGIYKADVGGRSFRQLYVNGRRAVRARSDRMVIRLYERINPRRDGRNASTGPITGRIILQANQLVGLGDLRGAEMHLNRKYGQHILRIEAIERDIRDKRFDSPTNVVVRFKKPEANLLRVFYKRTVIDSYFLENALSLLDEPGEWFLDEGEGVLYYRPDDSEDIGRSEFTVPVVEILALIDGAEDLRFEGIRFEHTAWDKPSRRGFLSHQAGFFETSHERAWDAAFLPPSGVTIRRSQNIRFTGCSFAHFGGGGVGIGVGSRDVTIDRCVITDISSNGINVDDYSDRPMSTRRGTSVRRVAITNCRITHCGKDFHASVGVWVGFALNVTLLNNEIAHLPYTAVSLGWRAGRSGVQGGMRVEGNDIHHYMSKLADGGGIYSLGNHKPLGTVIRRNYIHDVVADPLRCQRSARAGIYLDDRTTGILVTENVITIRGKGFFTPSLWGWARGPENYRSQNRLRSNFLTTTGHERIVSGAGPER